jgi:hypothetical protein
MPVALPRSAGGSAPSSVSVIQIPYPPWQLQLLRGLPGFRDLKVKVGPKLLPGRPFGSTICEWRRFPARHRVDTLARGYDKKLDGGRGSGSHWPTSIS